MSFKIMMIWGILTLGIGVSMFFTLQPGFDCTTLPKGYWDSECQTVNSIDLGLPMLPVLLGIGIIVSAFKLFREPSHKLQKTEKVE